MQFGGQLGGQAYGNPVMPTETRTFTVLAELANEEIAVRQTFGWTLLGSSARSFSTGGNLTAIGTRIGGLGVARGYVDLETAHFTDLTFSRAFGSHLQRLRDLEARFDAYDYDGPASRVPPLIAGVIAGPGLMSAWLNLGWPLNGPGPMLGFLAFGLVVFLTWNGIRQSRVRKSNEELREIKLGILQQARPKGAPQ